MKQVNDKIIEFYLVKIYLSSNDTLFMFRLSLSWIQDPDTQVTYDDQQKINQFARNNAKLQDLKDELENKKVIILVIFTIHNCGSNFNYLLICYTIYVACLSSYI